MMICPNCLEELTFVKFEVDPATIEHRGVFSCMCCDSYVLPEAMTREVLTDEDLKEQLRLSRLFHLCQSASEKALEASRRREEVIRMETRHLERYLQHFTEQSLRQLK